LALRNRSQAIRLIRVFFARGLEHWLRFIDLVVLQKLMSLPGIHPARLLGIQCYRLAVVGYRAGVVTGLGAGYGLLGVLRGGQVFHSRFSRV
jgi:hypothetical protein